MGVKRNHEYSKIIYDHPQKEHLKDKKTSIKKVFNTYKDEAEELIEKFRECEFNILDIQMWDHERKGVISHSTLREAFSFKFFNFGTSICETVLNLSYRFAQKHNKMIKNDDIMIDYVEMCKTLFNIK